MKRSILAIVCLTCLLPATQLFAAGDAGAGKNKVMMCAGCHGIDGNSMVSAFPKLAGLGGKVHDPAVTHGQIWRKSHPSNDGYS
jgi:cytochrome c553